MAYLQKTIKGLKEWINAPFALNTEINPQLVLDALELLKERQWIPVSERLPMNQNPVIVNVPPHVDSDGEQYVGYVGMAHYSYSPDGGWWGGTDGATYGAIGIIPTPTHWMPLPKPPKDGEQDG